MITFPYYKINLGLNIVAKRPDGYHDLGTVLYPVPLCDVLEIKKMDEEFPSPTPIDLKVIGHTVECDERNNLVVKAYHPLAKDYGSPRIHVRPVKRIPTQAGLGGGSADTVYTIRSLDERFRLNIDNAKTECYVAQLGADCAFFIRPEMAYATGIGDALTPANNEHHSLERYYLTLVKPDVAASTVEAYAGVTPKRPAKSCRDIVCQPIDTWCDELINDFEKFIFAKHLILADVKEEPYVNGASYAQMSGSGSTIFGTSGQKPANVKEFFPGMFTYCVGL